MPNANKTLKINMPSSLQICARSSIGKRNSQQDRYVICHNQNTTLAVVCDGMGGMDDGDIASQLTVDTFQKDFENLPPLDAPILFLNNEILKANEMVSDLEAPDGRRLSSGTTVVAALFVEDMLYAASAGDSRMYLLRNGQLIRLTRDHNYLLTLNELLLSGKISEEEYATEMEKSEALISYVGLGDRIIVDCLHEPIKLLPGDILLQCTDGLYRCLEDNEIASIISNVPANSELIAVELLKSALNKNIRNMDNTTLIVSVFG